MILALASFSAQNLQALEGAQSESEQQENHGERRHKLQVGVYGVAPWNLEHPFLDHAKTFNTGWAISMPGKETIRRGEFVASGYMDLETGFPNGLPKDAKYVTPGAILSHIKSYPDYYKGEYILEWDGEAEMRLAAWPKELQRREGKNRLVLTVDPVRASDRSLRITRIGKNFGNLRFYRREHEALLKSGEIWNPEFIDYMKHYDIIRTMDMQGINASPIRSFDEIATPAQLWGESSTSQWPAPPFYSIPYEILFDLGMKTNRELWLHIPLQIGAQISQAHPSLKREDKPNRIHGKNLASRTADDYAKIINSPEWDKFADQFLNRLIQSGYPTTRPLYLEMGNEVWNFAPPFTFASRYAEGIGRGFNSNSGLRHGYGILTARWMVALEDAMNERGVDYNITYVVASQTDWPARTRQAYDGMVNYLESEGLEPRPYLDKTGVALTSYIGSSKIFTKKTFGELSKDQLAPAWLEAIRKNPEGHAKRIKDFFVNPDPKEGATLGRVLKRWDQHDAIAKKYGVRLLGAYEGGSHTDQPRQLRSSSEFNAWWTDVHWGEEGADMVRQLNDALLERYPDIILSNYASIGTIGAAPWIDGHYARSTPMMEMWDEYAIPPDQR